MPTPVRVHLEFDVGDDARSMRILPTMFLTLASYIGSTLLFVEAAQSYAP